MAQQQAAQQGQGDPNAATAQAMVQAEQIKANTLGEVFRQPAVKPPNPKKFEEAMANMIADKGAFFDPALFTDSSTNYSSNLSQEAYERLVLDHFFVF